MDNDDNKQLKTPLTEHTITVLLIDDQLIVGEMVKRMLAPEKDIIFHFCQDPAQAIKIATEISPTVILQDLVMPEIDGLTLVKYFRANRKLKDIPLIVLSSKEEAVTKADAFALGANDYLVKLPDKIELIARIRYHSRGYIAFLQRNEAYEALSKSQQALAAQLNSAAEYVVSLLPAPIMEGNIVTDWRYVPSAQLGGDSFGYHWIDDEHFAVYLLDVCDHGVGPALLSVSALNVLRSQTLRNTNFRSPEEVLFALNETFQMEKQNNLYFTIWYGVYNKRTGELKHASAGHPPPLLVSASGDVLELRTQNMFIGGMPEMVYEGGAVFVDAFSRLYVFSDGVFEVTKTDGTMWSYEELKEFLRKKPFGGLSEIDELCSYLQEIHGSEGFEDDFSMLKVEFR
ncbi:MAG TPA: fused response regulator/phosphatase [Syntrophorhabdaceae bacterium]|nr:fused response regulator/phosphatase [Syntrophorhabdaceae bacterium]